MKIDKDQWVKLSTLLDQALDVEVGEREAWLSRLTGEPATLLEPLRALLTQHAQVETADFLRTPDFAAALRVELERSQVAPLGLHAGTQVGAYRLLRELGSGGMGSVWLAQRIDGKLTRQVALKFPYAGPKQRQLAERLARERDILARLEHPHIARLYDADVTALGQPFLVLEYVDGIPINEYCDRHALSLRDRLVLFLQVLSAVQYAHTHLVIHRDLKPSNILITPDGVARLLDFGIAKLVAAGDAENTPLTQFGGRALTPDYASPEQISGQAITTASDIYSLGVVLYELSTGSRPYRPKRATQVSLEDAIAEAEIIVPSRAAMSDEVAAHRGVSARKLARSLRGDLDAITCKALHKIAAQRYPSSDALAQDIERWLDGEVITAQRRSAGYSLRKLIGRNRVVFASAAAVCVSLVAGATVAVWQARAAIAQTERLQATKSFLVDVFNTNSREQSDPLKAQQTTARQLVDRAAERLVTAPRESTDAQEEMLQILGDLYESFGLDDKSAALRQRRVELLERLYGSGDARTAAAQIDYGKILYATNQWKSAFAPLHAAEATLDRLGDTTSLTRVHLLGALMQYWRGVDRNRARDYAARCLALEHRRYPKSAELIDDLHAAALIESESGNWALSIPMLEEALAVQEASGAPEIILVRPLVELAELQARQLDFDTAERNFRRAMEVSRRLNGDLNVDSIQVGMRFGKFLRTSGRLAESQATLLQTQDNAVKLLPADENFHLPTLRDELAQTEHALGNFARAAQLYRLALAAREKGRAGDRQHAVLLQHYARVLTDMGHGEQAQQLLTRALENYRRSDVPIGTTELPVILSATLASLGKQREALDILDTLDQGHERLGLQSQLALEFRRAAQWVALGELDRAESLLRQQLQRVADLPQRRQLRLLDAAGRLELGRLLVKRGRAAEARDLLETAMNWRAADMSATSPWLAESQVALAECLWSLGDPQRGRSLLVEARRIDAANPELGEQYRRPLEELSRHLAMNTPPHAARR